MISTTPSLGVKDTLIALLALLDATRYCLTLAGSRDLSWQTSNDSDSCNRDIDGRSRSKVRSGSRVARLNHARGWFDDWFWNFYRLVNHWAPGRITGMAACCVDRHRIAHFDGRPLLRRGGCNDAEGRRPICLFARSLFAAVGISLRLDTPTGHPNW